MTSDDRYQTLISRHLRQVVGLPLSIARDVAGMKVFHFGAIRPHSSGKGTVGTYALHVQCAWRIVSDGGVVTGSADRFVGLGGHMDVDEGDSRSGNLQLSRLEALLGGYDDATRSVVNAKEHLVVTRADTDGYGGIDLRLSGGYRLQVFTDGSIDEVWRFIKVDGGHLVMESNHARVE